ncbi:MAG: TonB-dependent receptor domain-containing protein, partial [Blastocatellia bacterium]
LWHGTFNFGFRDGPLNGRNAFAPVRGPEQYRRLGLDLESPIWRNHTSLFLSLHGYLSHDSKTIVAALPSGNFASLASPLTRTLNFSTRVEHALTKTHTLRAEYQRNAILNGDLGVGDFDLQERAYSANSVEHIFRLSDSGLLTEKAVNEIRMQARWQDSQSSSSTDARAVLVLNAFDSGGAQVSNSKRIADYEVADNLDFTTGKHAIKTGLLWQFHHYNTSDSQNAGGTFTFSSLAAFESGAPATFTQRLGSPQVIFNQYEFGWYVQDAVRIRKGLSLDLGLRDEFQSHVADISGFAPRFGLAWSPDGKLVVRAGAGIFHEWLDAGTFEQVLRDDGLHERDLVIQQPGFPNPLIGGIPLALPPGKDILDPTVRLPYLEHASLGLQRSLPANLSLNISYSYERGVHLFRGHNVNAPLPGLGRP